MSTSEPLLFLVGSTASGKGRIALEVAQVLDAEIVSLDSMKIYRGLDVGTAKPSPAARSRVPHHLIDVADPCESFDVARYVREADRVVEDVRRRGRRVLFVGGTALYLKGVLRGMFEGPPADLVLRARLLDKARDRGSAALHERLRRVDPECAARLHPNDLRRVVRALEVFEKTGEPLSSMQREWSGGPDRHWVRVAGLRFERAALHERIDRRVDRMIADGLLEEVRALQASRALGREASQAVGYKELLEHLAGKIDLEEAIRLVKRNTRRFAKRQETWWRHFPQIRWIDVRASEDLSAVVDRVLAAFRAADTEGP